MNHGRVAFLHDDKQEYMRERDEDGVDQSQSKDLTKSRQVHGYLVIDQAKDKQDMHRHYGGCVWATQLRNKRQFWPQNHVHKGFPGFILKIRGNELEHMLYHHEAYIETKRSREDTEIPMNGEKLKCFAPRGIYLVLVVRHIHLSPWTYIYGCGWLGDETSC